MTELLDLYTDYLQVAFGQASATGLSELLDQAVSHDKITRLLSNNDFSSTDLWLLVKALVREHETNDACLIFDDTIIHKPHTEENELRWSSKSGDKTLSAPSFLSFQFCFKFERRFVA